MEERVCLTARGRKGADTGFSLRLECGEVSDTGTGAGLFVGDADGEEVRRTVRDDLRAPVIMTFFACGDCVSTSGMTVRELMSAKDGDACSGEEDGARVARESEGPESRRERVAGLTWDSEAVARSGAVEVAPLDVTVRPRVERAGSAVEEDLLRKSVIFLLPFASSAFGFDDLAIVVDQRTRL